MSHITASKGVVTELPMLQRAVARFGQLAWLEGKTTFTWFGRKVGETVEDEAKFRGIEEKDYGKCIHAIMVQGNPYEIGVTALADGSGYALSWDYWLHPDHSYTDINAIIGKDGELLMRAYGEEVMRDHAEQMGMTVIEAEDEDTFTLELQEVGQ